MVVLAYHDQGRTFDPMQFRQEIHRLSLAAAKLSHQARIPNRAGIDIRVVRTAAVKRTA